MSRKHRVLQKPTPPCFFQKCSTYVPFGHIRYASQSLKFTPQDQVEYLTAEPELSAHVSVSIIDESPTDANRQSGTVFGLSGSLSGMLHFTGHPEDGFLCGAKGR